MNKRSPETEARRIEAVRKAMKRPDVKAKMIGHPCSTETRAKIGAANRGRYVGQKLSKETRMKMREGQKLRWQKLKGNPEEFKKWNDAVSKSLKGKYVGDKASNWRGGISYYKRNDNKVHAWRKAVQERDNFTCQVCLVYGGELHIDHIKNWANHMELRFEVSNGRTLCRACHYYVTFKRKMPDGCRWGKRKQLIKAST
jgi:hypothetical protein